MSKRLPKKIQNKGRKGILTFDLPEDNWEFRTAVKAARYRLFAECWYVEVFRPIIKYGAGVEEHKLDKKTVEYLADKMRECMDDYLGRE